MSYKDPRSEDNEQRDNVRERVQERIRLGRRRRNQIKLIDWSVLALDFQVDREIEALDDKLPVNNQGQVNNEIPPPDDGRNNDPPPVQDEQPSPGQLDWEAARERFSVLYEFHEPRCGDYVAFRQVFAEAEVSALETIRERSYVEDASAFEEATRKLLKEIEKIDLERDRLRRVSNNQHATQLQGALDAVTETSAGCANPVLTREQERRAEQLAEKSTFKTINDAYKNVTRLQSELTVDQHDDFARQVDELRDAALRYKNEHRNTLTKDGKERKAMCDTIIEGMDKLKLEMETAGRSLLQFARQLERLSPDRRTGKTLNDVEAQLQSPFIGQPYRGQIEQTLRNLRSTSDVWMRDLIANEQASPQRIVELNLEMGKGKLTDDEDGKGASVSMFIKGPNGKGAFVFKPNLGEAVAGAGWEQGGGAAREVMVCAVSKELGRITGLDFGVGETSLVKIRHPALDEVLDPPGEQVGSAQAFLDVDAENKSFSEKMMSDDEFLSKVDKKDTQKLALLDFTVLNLDRQPDNLLVKTDEDGNPHLKPIDGGNALPSREAFEARRTQFLASSIFMLPGADEPFDNEMQESIRNINPDEVAGVVARTNQQMAEVDPATAQKLGNENAEMIRRQLKLLKKLAPNFTIKEIGDAIANLLPLALDADELELDGVLDTIEKECRSRCKALDKLEELFPNGAWKQQVVDLGWPRSAGMFNDYTFCLDVVRNSLVQPLLAKELADLEEATTPIDRQSLRDYDSQTPDWKVSELKFLLKKRTVVENDRLIDLYNIPRTNSKGELRDITSLVSQMTQALEYQEFGGDAAIGDLFVPGMTFDQRIEAMNQIKFAELSNDLEAIENARFSESDSVKSKIVAIKDYREFIALGGEAAADELGVQRSNETALFSIVSEMKEQIAMREGKLRGMKSAWSSTIDTAEVEGRDVAEIKQALAEVDSYDKLLTFQRRFLEQLDALRYPA